MRNTFDRKKHARIKNKKDAWNGLGEMRREMGWNEITPSHEKPVADLLWK